MVDTAAAERVQEPAASGGYGWPYSPDEVETAWRTPGEQLHYV